MHHDGRHCGFTLVEILVASVICAFIAVVAVSSLRAVCATASQIEETTEKAAEKRFALNMMENDLGNFYRTADANNMKLEVEYVDETGINCRLIFFTVIHGVLRAGEPEGDVYEVEYFVQRNEEDETSRLMRRVWPYPEKKSREQRGSRRQRESREPQQADEPGGVIMPLAGGIDGLMVSFFDGENWVQQWDMAVSGLPDIVEVTVFSGAGGDHEPEGESFTVNFARSSGVQNTTGEGETSEDSNSTAQTGGR